MAIFCDVLVIRYQVWKVKARNIYRVRFKLGWTVKVVMKNVYIRERLSVKFPEKMSLSWNTNIRSAIIRQQLRTKDKKLSDKFYSSYYHIKIWSCDTIVRLFGVRSTWQVVWVSKKVNDPTMSGVVLVLMLLRSLLAWSRLWSKHEMHAAELSDWVDSDVQASAVSVRVQMRESSSNIYWDIIICFYVVGFTINFYFGNKHFLSTATLVTLMMKHWWMEDARTVNR